MIVKHLNILDSVSKNRALVKHSKDSCCGYRLNFTEVNKRSRFAKILPTFWLEFLRGLCIFHQVYPQ